MELITGKDNHLSMYPLKHQVIPGYSSKIPKTTNKKQKNECNKNMSEPTRQKC